jgi:site-specific recombinase XerC
MRSNEELGAFIADFLEGARAGVVRAPGGSAYTPAELRSLRGALSHVTSELGARDVAELRSRDVRALVDGLLDAGLSPTRAGAILDALRQVYAYAVERGLVTASPLVGLAPAAPEGPSPTTAMLELGEQLARFTGRLMVLLLVLAAVGFAVALA